jgi:hypothetical protein
MSADINEIHSEDLEKHSDSFFNWLMNLAIVRAYNALEILILQTINAAYLNSFNTLSDKKEMNKIHSEIDRLLINKSSRLNNKHLIQFLKEQSAAFNSWIQFKVRVDCQTTWDDFFYLNSVLRHCIVYQAMLLNKNSLNDINSKSSKDLFNRYFKIKEVGINSFELQPIQDRFDDFLNMTIGIATNTLKFVSNQKDLSFLRMY